MDKLQGFKITDSNYDEYACGNCSSVMMGDEDICPICGKLNDFSSPIKITCRDLTELVNDARDQESREILARFNGKDYT